VDSFQPIRPSTNESRRCENSARTNLSAALSLYPVKSLSIFSAGFVTKQINAQKKAPEQFIV
jgi:hypothetical protein